jgi:CubicO group peptidase (beta-lactamase class C family)
VLSVAVALLLSVTLPAALVLLAGESGRWRRPARAAAVGVLVLVLGVDLAYGWAWASTDRSRLARTIVWQESDVLDCRRFPARAVATRPPPFQFRRSVGADRLPAVTVPVRRGGQVVERDLEGFLRSTGTTGFLVLKGDTLVSEAYFHGYRHDSTVSSFSVAKPVVSALVGIAIAQGRIGSVDDPVTRYLPELADRDPRFGTITLRHLLTMSSGLADLDPYYDLDLRAVALRDTRIAGPAGRRFHYNNVNPVLLGMVLERATGRTVSTYLSERLWGPLGMEADGSWSLDSRRSGLELLQAGLNGRAVDFAKLGAVYLHGGVWRGRQLVPRRWVADSTRADTRTDPSSRVPVRLVDPTRDRPRQRLLGPGQPRPVRLRRPQPRRGPGPLRHRLPLRPLAGPAGHPGPPPLNPTEQQGRPPCTTNPSPVDTSSAPVRGCRTRAPRSRPRAGRPAAASP